MCLSKQSPLVSKNTDNEQKKEAWFYPLRDGQNQAQLVELIMISSLFVECIW